MVEAIRAALSKVHDAGAFYRDLLADLERRHTLTPATYSQAVEAFQAFRRTEVSDRHWKDDQWRLRRLFDPFEHYPMTRITEADLRVYFDGLKKKINPRTIFRTVKTFFGWARRYNYVATDPMVNLTPKEYGDFGTAKDFYEPAEFDRDREKERQAAQHQDRLRDSGDSGLVGTRTPRRRVRCVRAHSFSRS
jgi:hypothetical protein